MHVGCSIVLGCHQIAIPLCHKLLIVFRYYGVPIQTFRRASRVRDMPGSVHQSAYVAMPTHVLCSMLVGLTNRCQVGKGSTFCIIMKCICAHEYKHLSCDASCVLEQRKSNPICVNNHIAVENCLFMSIIRIQQIQSYDVRLNSFLYFETNTSTVEVNTLNIFNAQIEISKPLSLTKNTNYLYTLRNKT